MPQRHQRLADRRLLVTGASSGIGRAIAEACLAEGAKVAVLARRRDRLEELSAGGGAVPVVGDLADLGSAAGLVAEAVASLGGLDGLVNAAGIARPGLIAEADPEDWRAMFDVNVLGLLAITQAAIPHLLRASGPSIVNISSMSGRRVPAAAGGTYAATKFAVHAISEALRQELQASGVRVTTVSPGFVATEIFKVQAQTATTRSYDARANGIGIAPADVAEAVVHALAAPPGVTTVEIAVVPTAQDDGRYADAVDPSGDDGMGSD